MMGFLSHNFLEQENDLREIFIPLDHSSQSGYRLQVAPRQSLLPFHLTGAKIQHFDNECIDKAKFGRMMKQK